MIKRAVLLAVLLCAPFVMVAQAKMHHALFVLTSPDPADWQSAMILPDHFLRGIQPESAEVEVLIYGPAISTLAKGSPVADQIAALQQKGVHFVACQNAMRAHNIAAADLLPGVTSVPVAVVELVTKQEAGWAYIKVGR